MQGLSEVDPCANMFEGNLGFKKNWPERKRTQLREVLVGGDIQTRVAMYTRANTGGMRVFPTVALEAKLVDALGEVS